MTSWSVVGWSTGRVRRTLGKGCAYELVGEEVFALEALRPGTGSTGTGAVALHSQSADPSPQEPATQAPCSPDTDSTRTSSSEHWSSSDRPNSLVGGFFEWGKTRLFHRHWLGEFGARVGGASWGVLRCLGAWNPGNS